MPTKQLQKQKNYFEGYFTGMDMVLSIKAMHLVLKYHKGTRKDGKTPEASHLFEVAGSILANLEGKVSTEELDIIVSAGFLHDLPEDYGKEYSFQHLIQDFGEDIYRVVVPVTKPDDFKKIETDYRIYYENISQDFRSIIVKGYDRCHNLSTTYNVFTTKRIKEYIEEVNTFLLPMIKKGEQDYPKMKFIFLDLRMRLIRECDYLNILIKRDEMLKLCIKNFDTLAKDVI